MNATPAAKSPTWTATAKAGVFVICSSVVGCCLGAMIMGVYFNLEKTCRGSLPLHTGMCGHVPPPPCFDFLHPTPASIWDVLSLFGL